MASPQGASLNGAARDRFGRPVVAVTGLGVITSLGVGREDNWRRLTAGESGIHRITRFPTDGLRTTIAGTVDFLSSDPLPAPVLSERFATLAGEEAIAQSGISGRDFPGPLFLAVPPVEMEWPQRVELAREAGPKNAYGYDDFLAVAGQGHQAMYETFLFGGVADRLSDRFGTRGSPISLSTACASGGTAIQLGVEAIQRGETEAALCIGTDGSVHPEALIRFSLLSALSTQNDPPEGAARPFSKNRDGFVMAEGAGALVLESLEHARARGARVLGVLMGTGERADSFHRTRSNPDGSAIIATIRGALEDSGLEPGDIDYINAHGTGTPENDKMEALSVSAVFGEAAPPMSSNKSMIGHTLTAAGAVEAVFTLLTIQHGRLPPTINHAEPDPSIALDVVPNRARDAELRRAMSNSFGFGGQNVCLVMAGEPG